MVRGLGESLQVLQMVGRAGRPQFDNEGVAVIMTSKDSIRRYQSMMTGQVGLQAPASVWVHMVYSDAAR